MMKLTKFEEMAKEAGWMAYSSSTLRKVDVGKVRLPKNTSTQTVMNEYVNTGVALLDIITVYVGEILKVNNL